MTNILTCLSSRVSYVDVEILEGFMTAKQIGIATCRAFDGISYGIFDIFRRYS